jgi:CubicO group peptidase (beta-lactamase class C family)
MRSARVSLLLLVALACDGPAEVPEVDAYVPPPVDGGPPADLDGYIEWQMDAGGIPGVAIALLEGDQITEIHTYGFADVENEVPVDEHTIFLVASVSKTIAVGRVMQLVEDGLLDLDAPIETYVPYTVRHPAHPDAVITLRMLLTHTSGLDDTWSMLARATTSGTDPVETLSGFSEGYVIEGGAYWSELNWKAQPSTDREYCNAAFAIVGDAIERAGGASFREQTSTSIFEALEMDGAGWFIADVDPARLAVPYSFTGRLFTPYPQTGLAFYPAGSLRVSVTGIARYLLAIGNGGALGGSRILEQASVDEMLRIQFPEVSRGQALTFSQERINDHLYIGHSGSTSGGAAQILWSTEDALGIVLLTNSDAYIRSRLGFPEGEDAMTRILERLDEEVRN